MNSEDDFETVVIRSRTTEDRRRAKLLRNRTIKNPRFYLLLAVSIFLLPVSLPIFFAKILADWMDRGANATEDFFVRLLHPFNQWVDRGAKNHEPSE